MMNTKVLMAFLFTLSLGTGSALTQEPGADQSESLELTMTLLPEKATQPDALTKTIELPTPASPTAVEKAAAGLAKANESRERREAGLDTAAEARERGREFGQDMAAEAQENRENSGRGNAPDHPQPPEHPTPPDSPGPPTP
jgi:hypothetical protein